MRRNKHLFIGVDGGATKCIVRVEDSEGRLLGRAVSGPANIRLSVTQAWESIHSALNQILKEQQILADQYVWHAGMGLAGYEIVKARADFLNQPHFFESFIISSDAHAACLGAHEDGNGAVIIIGTGVVGFQIEADKIDRVGGWGFPHDDRGGGAWLGLQAVSLTLQSLDGRCSASDLTRQIYAVFNNDLISLMTWANHANSTAFAELAPIVIERYQAGDAMALQLMQQAADAVNQIGWALQQIQIQSEPLACCLVGGLSEYIKPFLKNDLRARIKPCFTTPDAGAIKLVKASLTN